MDLEADEIGVALVTGGARRIGAEICRSLANFGYSVIIHYNNSEDDAIALSNEISASAECAILPADLSCENDVNCLMGKATKLFGEITLLVNNASHFNYDSLETLDYDSLNSSIAINLAAPLVLSRAFSEQISEEGCIINILDQKIANTNPDYFSYTVAKNGLASITESLAMALAPNVRVNAVAPGLTLPSRDASTEEFEEVHGATPLGRGSTAKDVGEAVVFLSKATSVTGQTIFVDGGERLVPRSRDVLFRGGE